MNRPHTTIQILSSLNGRINGPYMDLAITAEGSKYYGQARNQAHADAWLYGTTTVDEFLDGQEPDLVPYQNQSVEAGDFVCPKEADVYFVALDSMGQLGWTSRFYERPGRPKAQVIEIVSALASQAYLAYLRDLKISYIMMDSENLDARILSEKLYSLFGIEKMLICGGGMADWTFLSAGVVDELSLFLVPTADGEVNSASVFAKIPGSTNDAAVSFEFRNVDVLKDGIVHLTYIPTNIQE